MEFFFKYWIDVVVLVVRVGGSVVVKMKLDVKEWIKLISMVGLVMYLFMILNVLFRVFLMIVSWFISLLCLVIFLLCGLYMLIVWILFR